MPYTFVFNKQLSSDSLLAKEPSGKNFDWVSLLAKEPSGKNFDLVSHLVDQIKATLDTEGTNLPGYQTPIELSEIKLFNVGSLSYMLPDLTKPRLLYLPCSSYDAAVKRGNLRETGLRMSILSAGTGRNPFFTNLPRVVCHNQIKTELNSLSQPCFLVVGEDDDIESFKEKWATATNQPYFWRDIIKAFFAKILAFFCCGFVDQKQENALTALDFPSVGSLNKNSQPTSPTNIHASSSPVSQPTSKQQLLTEDETVNFLLNNDGEDEDSSHIGPYTKTNQ